MSKIPYTTTVMQGAQSASYANMNKVAAKRLYDAEETGTFTVKALFVKDWGYDNIAKVLPTASGILSWKEGNKTNTKSITLKLAGDLTPTVEEFNSGSLTGMEFEVAGDFYAEKDAYYFRVDGANLHIMRDELVNEEAPSE